MLGRKIHVLGIAIFLLWDFSFIRLEGERKHMGSSIRDDDMFLFNEFISKPELVDLPLHERRITWSRTVEEVMS